MKKLLSLLVLGLFTLIYSCGPSKALVMESPNLSDYKFSGKKVIIEGEKCKETENVIKNSFEKLGIIIAKDIKENPEYKCVLDCKYTYTNSLTGKKVASKIDMIAKIYTFKEDKILYTIQLSDENYLGVDLKLFEEDFFNDFKKSIE